MAWFFCSLVQLVYCLGYRIGFCIVCFFWLFLPFPMIFWVVLVLYCLWLLCISRLSAVFLLYPFSTSDAWGLIYLAIQKKKKLSLLLFFSSYLFLL